MEIWLKKTGGLIIFPPKKNAIKSYAAQSMIVPTAFAGHSKIFTPIRFVKDTELF